MNVHVTRWAAGLCVWVCSNHGLRAGLCECVRSDNGPQGRVPVYSQTMGHKVLYMGMSDHGLCAGLCKSVHQTMGCGVL